MTEKPNQFPQSFLTRVSWAMVLFVLLFPAVSAGPVRAGDAATVPGFQAETPDRPVLVAAKENSLYRRRHPDGAAVGEAPGVDLEALKAVENRVNALERNVSSEIKGLRSSIEEIRGGAGRSGPAARGAGQPVKLKSKSTGAVQSKYNQARGLYQRRSYAEAIRLFAEILNQDPDDPLAPNARYWIGESQYDQGRYKDAVVEFERVVLDYPNSDKAPDALLKMAYCHDKLKDGAAAMTDLGDLLKRYPRSEAARLVKTGQARFNH